MRTAARFRRVCLGALATTVGMALASPAAAQAEIFSGSQTAWSPAPAFDMNRNAYNPSLTKLDVRYDNQAGVLATSLTLREQLKPGQYYSASYALSTPPRGETCSSATSLIPLARWDAYSSGSGYTYSSIRFEPASGYTGEHAGAQPVQNGSQYSFTSGALQALTRQGLNCVSSLKFYANQQYSAPTFCLVSCGDAPELPKGTDGPVAPTGVSASVDKGTVRLTWDPSPNPKFAYFAVRRGTRLDSDPAKWTRLAPNYSTPTASDTPPGPGVYHYYVTEIDTSRRVSARSNFVRAEVVASSPVVGGDKQPGDGPASGGGEADGPSTVVTPVVAPPITAPARRGQRSMSKAQAQYQASRALRRTYRRAYANGSRVRSTCRRNSSTKYTCRVSWRYKRSNYRGNVVVKLSDGEYYTRVNVRRSR